MTAATVVTSHRRYCLLKAYAADAVGEIELSMLWLGKQRAIAGTALDADFPHLTTLDAADYTTTEDLDGATEEELQTNAGLSRSQAAAVLAAL